MHLAENGPSVRPFSIAVSTGLSEDSPREIEVSALDIQQQSLSHDTSKWRGYGQEKGVAMDEKIEGIASELIVRVIDRTLSSPSLSEQCRLCNFWFPVAFLIGHSQIHAPRSYLCP